jgi:hypothetical protein
MYAKFNKLNAMPCSPVKVYRRFGGMYVSCFLAWLTLRSRRWKQYVLPKRQLNSARLRSVTFQKAVQLLFIVIIMIT